MEITGAARPALPHERAGCAASAARGQSCSSAWRLLSHPPRAPVLWALAQPSFPGAEPPLPPPLLPAAEKIGKILTASGIEVEPYWPTLFAKLCKGKDMGSMISAVGSGGGGGAPTP